MVTHPLPPAGTPAHGSLALLPLCPGHYHVDIAAATPDADKPLAPLGNGGLGTYRSAIPAASGSTLIAACLAPDDKPTRAAAALPSVMGGPGGDFFRRSVPGASSLLGGRLRWSIFALVAGAPTSLFPQPTVALSAVG
jgi:hypothetical protein